MQLVRIDSHNRSILFVKIAYMEDVLTVQRIYFVVEFVPEKCELPIILGCEKCAILPESQSSKLRSGKG